MECAPGASLCLKKIKNNLNHFERLCFFVPPARLQRQLVSGFFWYCQREIFTNMCVPNVGLPPGLRRIKHKVAGW